MAKEITYKGQTVSEDLLKQKADSLGITIDQYLEDYKDDFVVTEEIQEDNTTEVTDEIQTPVTEGKTNGAVAKGATATPKTGQAPESTESEPDDILSGLEEIKDVREIDKRIKLIAGDDMQVDPLDSTKRITQYKELINRRNNIIGNAYNLGQTQQYQQLDFDPMSPAKIPLEKEGAPEGGVKLAYVPFTVDGEVVGTTMEPVGLQDVVVTAEQYKERENQIQSEAYKNFLEQSGLSTEPLSREEFEAAKQKEGDITEIKTTPYRGLDPIQAFENIGTMLSSFQQTAQEKENYRLQYENYLKKFGILNPDVKRKIPNFLESALGSTANMFLQIGGVDDRALYNLSFMMSNVPDDVYANIFGKDLGDDLKKEAIKGFSNINEKINYLNSLTSDTVGFTDVGDVEGVLGKTGVIAGGSYNALTSFVASYVTNVATSGVGLASDMIANSIKSYNDELAIRENVTVEELIASGKAEVIIPAFLGTVGFALEKAGLDKVGSIISTGLKQGTAKSLVSLLTAGGAEGTTEYLQGLVETYNVALAQGLSTEDALEKVRKELTSKESLERVLQGAVGGSGMVLGSQGLRAVSALRSPAENKKLIKIINQLNELENSKFRKNLTADQVAEINTAQEELRFNLKNIVDNNNELISTLTKQQIETLNSNADFLTTSASKINEIQNSEAYTEQDKEVLISAINQQRELASQNIFNIRNEAEKLQSQIEKVKGLTSLVKGLNIEEADTAADAEKFAEDNNLDIKSSTSQGYILQNPETGEQTIVINKETALNEQAVNVAGHEFLHALLFKTVKDSPQTAINLGNALLSELNKIDVNKIKDSNFKKRMEQYNDQSREVKMEEALTLFSDALATGDIQFKENAFTKLGDTVRRVAQKFGVKIKFNTGRDVYNFIKDYNRSIEKGNLSLAQVQAAAKGVEGELVAPTEQQADELIVKEARSDEASQRVQEIYEQQGEAGTFEIIEQFKPITSRIVERRSEAPGFDRQLLTDEIETGKRGIIDLIKEYDPESGVPLAAYINKFLPARAIEASKRVLGEEFTEDVTEARGVAAEEVVTETAIKPEAKAIDPFRIMPNVREAAITEVQESIADKDVDVTEVTYKELKDVAPYQTVADFFNIPVSRIKNPKDNLRKSDDVANIQRWILKNEPTLKNLFTEANRDVVEVKEGNKVIRQGGEPTAIPRNLLNKFYTKGDRVGNNFQWKLKPYDRTTFLEAVGIKNGKVDPNFTPRAAEAQTIKGILDMYTRNLGNVAARDIIEGREDIAPAEKARAKAEVAKGKPRIMFAISRKFDKKTLVKVTEARSISAVAKILDMSKVTVNDDNRVEKQKQVEKAIVAAGITSWMFEGSKFGATGRRKVKGVYINVPNKNGLYYGNNDPAYQRALALAKKNDELYDIKPPKRVPAKKADTEEMKQRSKDNLKALEFYSNKLADAVAEKQMPLEIAALFVTSGYQATYGIIKIAAPFRYFSKNPQFSTNPKAKANQRAEGKGEKFREEHNPPASVIGATLIYAIATNSMNKVMPDIKNNYYQTNLSKVDDFKIDQAGLDATLPVGTTIADNPAIRFIDAGIDLNSIVNYETGQTMAEELGVALKPSDVNVDTVFEQNKILKQVLSGDITAKTGQNRLNKIAKLKSIPKASISNNNENSVIKFSEQVPNQEVLDNLDNADKAMANARNPEAPVKKIRVFDFDDTLARSNSKVLYEMPDGTEGSLNATQFAERAGDLEAQGAQFDFSEFSKVVDGKKGPVFKAIENIVKARGAEDVFILTARPANAAGPIKEFMDALGVNLPIENIVGLGDGKAEAKARWMTSKAAEGYNDFFFVDDAYKNVKAVQDALDVFDVKSKTQQAKVKFSKKADLDKGFNDILEQTTGIASEKEYKRVKAEVAGASRGLAIRGIPYSAQDLVGLLYETLGKGKLGDAQMAWWKKHLLDPYARAMNDIDNARLSVMQDYRALKKQLGVVPKNLRAKVPGEPFTREQAVRVYIWNKLGYDVPGISKKDLKDLSEYVSDNADLQVFADQVIAIQKGEYAKPKEGWPAGTITTDIQESINTGVRAKYLTQWQNNVDVIFSEKNMNKLEAVYGKKYRIAMENMLQRMKTGRNRNFSDDSLTGRFTDWLQASTGAIMFFNSRSAILQTISNINFLNFTDNNPFLAAKAFANQKQYWSDFMTLINSDFLKVRRAGLRMNVSEADIADMAKKGGPRAVISKLLQFGFTPTQIADSFAIASGGATFYRNRIKTYEKQGLSKAEAETKAFEDFRETAEESQQSARPDRISMQQAGPLGRFILAFQNVTMQYTRIQEKAIRDLYNRRGDDKTNISKIIYYGTVQNFIFNALQQALFAFAFDDEEPEDEEKKTKYFSIANSMLDSILRGTGIAGGVLSVTKNAIIRIIRESEKKNPNYEKVGADLMRLAPPVSSKFSKINQAARSYKWDKQEMKEKGWSLDNPAYLASANVISATTNVPIDRIVKKVNNVTKATDSELETWERLALLGGWQDWEIGVDEEKPTNKPQPRKTKSTITKKRKPSKR